MKKLIMDVAKISTSTLEDNFDISSASLLKTGFNQRYINNQFGYSGENISPEIHWENAPKETKSFVVTLFDIDAPTGSGWWHWVIANIPANINKIQESAGNNPVFLPKGAELVRNDFGNIYYGGPCPPKDEKHRYQFTVYALNIDHIDINEATSPALIGFIANTNLLAKKSIIYEYAND